MVQFDPKPKPQSTYTEKNRELQERFRIQKYGMRGLTVNLYEKLVDLYDSMQSLLNYFQGADEPSLDEKAQVFRDAHNEFIRAVARNKIYFGKDTCEIMDRLFFSSRDTYIDKTTYPIDPRHPELHAVNCLYQERTEMWEKAREAFKLQEGYHLSERETGKGVPFTPRRGELTSNNWIERDSVLALPTIDCRRSHRLVIKS